MPDSPHYGVSLSSPLHQHGSRRSRFTYRHLALLASSGVSNPLRVIAHIDLDAFYAQCEMVRLNVPEDQPLAVQQWQGLIAVNYPARASGIGRHCNVTEAMKLCPNLIAQHVATWREGDEKWAYRDDAAAHIATDKVSLDPYRLQSRKILALIKDSLPSDMQKVEKASIDEVFLDLSAQVHAEMLVRFPELSAPPPYDDVSEALPLPSIVALDWKADHLVDLDEDQEALDPDWDDVAILVGSEIVRKIRARIREELGYTCSAGIASNKLVSKLGSGFKKPNQQTVVRSRAAQGFLTGFKISKLRNLGGKLGDQVTSTFHTEDVKQLLDVTLEQLKQKLGPDTGQWVHNTIRGIDTSEVNSRVQIKSMLSAKSFRPTISSFEQAVKWLRIFAADIYSRLVEEGVLEHKRRPRSINLHHRQAGHTRSRQGPIPQGKAITEQLLFDLAKGMLGQIIAEGKVWPCANLSLSVGGFEDGVKGNLGIDAFLIKGDEAASYLTSASENRASVPAPEQPVKRRRAETGGIQRFFAKKSISGERADPGPDGVPDKGIATGGDEISDADQQAEQDDMHPFACPRCNARMEDPESLQSHQDWHMAKDLQDAERVTSTFAERPASRNSVPKRPSAPSKRGRGAKLDHGQTRLNFG
ncbi:impB/mucB/samB family protein [Stachybotrys elegans]|uniref:DNA polymerase eta n=1 Tax=Stachybotrys elegans TaxID=80388 RepID=A0A8K0WM72_9HYPO|nr:impB/mucB/samB family protein [Stachybotrys elegans]